MRLVVYLSRFASYEQHNAVRVFQFVHLSQISYLHVVHFHSLTKFFVLVFLVIASQPNVWHRIEVKTLLTVSNEKIFNSLIMFVT